MFEKTIRKWAQINLSPIHTQIQKDICEVKEKNELEIKSINEKIDAIIECIRSDRKDINALINIYKTMKPQTKRKK